MQINIPNENIIDDLPKIEKNYVIKRNGRKEDIDINKIRTRITEMVVKTPILENIDIENLVNHVSDTIVCGITTKELDQKTMEDACTLSTRHYEYSYLAGRLAISNLHKETPKLFSEAMFEVSKWINPITGKPANLLSRDFITDVELHKDELDKMIDHEKDYDIDYFGFKTLERAYLFKLDGRTIERPQYMFMRVALAIHKSDLQNVKNTYELLCNRLATHATPTLFSAGSPYQQFSSCFLNKIAESSIKLKTTHFNQI